MLQHEVVSTPLNNSKSRNAMSKTHVRPTILGALMDAKYKIEQNDALMRYNDSQT